MAGAAYGADHVKEICPWDYILAESADVNEMRLPVAMGKAHG